MFRVFGIWLFVLVAIAVCGYQLINAKSYQLFGDIYAHGPRDQKQIALTFDDGPSKKYTTEILKILAEHNVTATFYLVGKDVTTNLATAKNIVVAGHEVGNHTFAHKRQLFMGKSEISTRLRLTDLAIREAGYDGSIHFRPPYGDKFINLPRALSEQKKATIMWSLEPEKHAPDPTDPASLVSYFKEHVEAGDIVLLHPMFREKNASREALAGIIEAGHELGLEFVTVSELLDLK